ncbi:MAG: LptF/LptG family permease [Paracoccaceae bacterium]
MTRLDRYVLSQLLWIFGFFSMILVSVYWVNRAVALFDQLIRDGQPIIVFVEFTALSLPMLIRTVLPVSAFVAATYVTLGLLRSSELTSAQAAGISPFRLARPYAVFGLIVSLFLMLLMNVIIPEARSQLARRQAEIAQNITSGLLQEGVFQHPAEGVTVFISEITPEGAMRGIYLSDARSAMQRVDYTAQTALIVPDRTGPKLVMIDGQAQIHDAESGRLSVTGFDDFTYDLGLMAGPEGGGRNVRELSTRELMAATPELLEETRATEARFRFELVSRFVDGFNALAAALIGFATLVAGAFSRLGFWRQVTLAVVMIGVIQALTNTLADVAMRSVAFSWLGIVPLTLAFAMAGGMLWRASRVRRIRRGAPA